MEQGSPFFAARSEGMPNEYLWRTSMCDVAEGS